MSDPIAETVRLNSQWGYLIIEELTRCGVTCFCISPGSRSTPLTAAAARHPGVKTGIFFDERGAAFHALGYARAAGRPAALICTSGTAVANYFPAIIEAAMDGVPLIILSADRPPELRETGANQTIRQTHLFGDYLRWHFDMPCPDAAIPPETVLTTVDQAVYRACRAPAGPVHLNCMFREPFGGEPPASDLPEVLAHWQHHDEPYTRYALPVSSPATPAIAKIAGIINRTRRGILSVGRLDDPAAVTAARQFAGALGWPVFPDVTSGLRLGSPPKNAIPYFDQLLLWEELVPQPPETVLHLGGQMVSKRWQQFLTRQSPGQYLLVSPHPLRQDPGHRVTERIESDITTFVAALLPHLPAKSADPVWLAAFQNASEKSGAIIERTAEKQSAPVDEISAARLVSRHLTAGSALFLASSMPVRDMDMYGATRADLPTGVAVRVGANRGASGIDGTIAAATGFAVGCDAPVVLLLGDLAALHDLNALALVKRLPQPLILVILNNRGGGIFHFLPVAGQSEIFEPFFATPHEFTFEHAAAQFGLAYAHPRTNGEFANVFQQWQQDGVRGVIEISSDRVENLRRHREVQEKIIAVIAQHRGGKS